MKLFEANNGCFGESYVRCYVWARDESRAKELLKSVMPDAKDLEELFDSSETEFVTDLSDQGFIKAGYV